MRPVLISAVLLVISGAARAGDFGGFYAGINAGYARGGERDQTVTGPVADALASRTRPGVGSDLPPSAQGAAAALRRSDLGSAAARPGR